VLADSELGSTSAEAKENTSDGTDEVSEAGFKRERDRLSCDGGEIAEADVGSKSLSASVDNVVDESSSSSDSRYPSTSPKTEEDVGNGYVFISDI
jgi:hypothetical protein